jgi:predicted metalloendopeptidase
MTVVCIKWEINFPTDRIRIGSTAFLHRWKGCAGNVNSNFGMAVSYLYVQKHFNNESREKVCSPHV